MARTPITYPRRVQNDPSSVAGLCLWLKPRPGRVWQDSARTSLATADLQTVNAIADLYRGDTAFTGSTGPQLRKAAAAGRDLIEFNGSSHTLTGSWTQAPANGKTVFAVTHADTNASGNVGCILACNSANWYVGWVPINRLLRMSYSVTAGTQQTVDTPTQAYVADRVNLFTYHFDVQGSNVTVTLRVNGVQKVQSAFATGVTATAPAATWRLGSFNGASFYIDGCLGDVCVYSRALVLATEVAQIEAALMAEYGIS